MVYSFCPMPANKAHMHVKLCLYIGLGTQFKSKLAQLQYKKYELTTVSVGNWRRLHILPNMQR